MTEKKLIAKIIRKKGCIYFVDGEGRVWEQKSNKGITEKMLEKIRLKKEKKESERYF